MRESRLALLIVCALLSTSIQLPGWMTSGTSREADASQALPAVSAGPPPALASHPDAGTASEFSEADLRLEVDFVRRLAARHTGLADRERLRVARAIIREARAHDLAPELVIAVIEVESAGYHLAVSHVGALGLMQLLPSTAEELAGKHAIEWLGDDTLFDPVVNIKLGTAYLRELADRYGDVSVALAAYNWGPGRIDRRLRQGATVPSKYIEQVMQAYDRGTVLASASS